MGREIFVPARTLIAVFLLTSLHLANCVSGLRPLKNRQKTTLKGRAKRKTVSLRAYLQALRDRRWRGQQISPPLRVSRARTDHSCLALRTEKSLSYPKIADEVIESNLLGEEEKCPANLRVNEKR
jgi:hypothetical protein